MSNPGDWEVIYCHPYPHTRQRLFSRNFISAIALLWPAAKFVEALILTTVNTHLLPVSDQHGFRTGHSTTSALLQLTSDVTTGFNQRKPPHRTVCVAVDLTAAFDTVNHNALLSKITRSMLPEATCQWQRCQVKDKDNPHWRSARLEVVTHAIQLLHS